MAIRTPPPAPPRGLDVELTLDGFRCTLAPARSDVSPWLSTAHEARLFFGWLALIALFAIFGGLIADQVEHTGVEMVITGLKLASMLVAGPLAYLLFDHTVLRRRWTVVVDNDAVHLTPVVLGRPMSPRVLPLETVREASVERGPPHELLLRTTKTTHRLRTSQLGAELEWIADAVGYARERKASFWREVLAPARRKDREALSRITVRDP